MVYSTELWVSFPIWDHVFNVYDSEQIESFVSEFTMKNMYTTFKSFYHKWVTQFSFWILKSVTFFIKEFFLQKLLMCWYILIGFHEIYIYMYIYWHQWLFLLCIPMKCVGTLNECSLFKLQVHFSFSGFLVYWSYLRGSVLYTIDSAPQWFWEIIGGLGGGCCASQGLSPIVHECCPESDGWANEWARRRVGSAVMGWSSTLSLESRALLYRLRWRLPQRIVNLLDNAIISDNQEHSTSFVLHAIITRAPIPANQTKPCVCVTFGGWVSLCGNTQGTETSKTWRKWNERPFGCRHVTHLAVS
jgi:hypothetical protein